MILIVTVILSLTAAIGTDAYDGCQQCALPPTINCKQLQNTTNFVSDNGELNTKGAGDRADALSNFRDTCNGNEAKRSTYCCIENGTSACAQGGSVCVDHNVILFLDGSLEGGYVGKVISIVGGCHVNNTSSYDGQRAQVVLSSNDNGVLAEVKNVCIGTFGTFSEGPVYRSNLTFFCDFSLAGTTTPVPTTPIVQP